MTDSDYPFSTANNDVFSKAGYDSDFIIRYPCPIPEIPVPDYLKDYSWPRTRSKSPVSIIYFHSRPFEDAFIFPGPTEDPKAPFTPRKFDTPEEEEDWWNDPKLWPMDHLLKPYKDEMWTTLEEMNSPSGSSGCSTCLSPSPLEAETEAELGIKAEPTGSSTQHHQQHHLSSPRSLRRVGSEGPAVPPTPTTPEPYPEIDPQLLVPLQTLATVATCSPDSLQRLTTQTQSQNRILDINSKGKGFSRVGEEEEEEEEEEDDEAEEDDEDKSDSESLASSSRSPHHTRSPRSYTNHQAHRNAKRRPLQKGQREAMPRTSRATHQNHHRQVVSPTRTLRRRPSPSSASPSPRPRPRALSQSQSQAPSQPSSAISGASGSRLPSGDQQDIIIRYPQAKGSRRPALDISSERLLTSLREQLREGVFPRYTMPHPKRDGNVSGKKWRCTYDLEDGGRCNAACSRKGEARRHAFTHEIHLRWICPSLSSKVSTCGKLFARQDAAIRHVEQSRSCKDLAANRTKGFPVLVWEEEEEIVAKIVTLFWNQDNGEGDE